MSACAHSPADTPSTPPVPADPAATLTATLAAGSALAAAAELQAITHGDGVACWVEGGISSGLALAASVVSHPDALPGLSVDLSPCAQLHQLPTVPVPDVVASGIAVAMGPARAAIAGIADCRVRVILDAVTVWLGGLVPAALDEAANPDGILSVPPVAILVCTP